MDEDRGGTGEARARIRHDDVRARVERARALPPDELARVLLDRALVLAALRRAVAPGWTPLPPDATLAA
jgi:hypothetical protein